MRGPTLSPVSLLCFTCEPLHMGNCRDTTTLDTCDQGKLTGEGEAINQKSVAL